MLCNTRVAFGRARRTGKQLQEMARQRMWPGEFPKVIALATDDSGVWMGSPQRLHVWDFKTEQYHAHFWTDVDQYRFDEVDRAQTRARVHLPVQQFGHGPEYLEHIHDALLLTESAAKLASLMSTRQNRVRLIESQIEDEAADYDEDATSIDGEQDWFSFIESFRVWDWGSQTACRHPHDDAVGVTGTVPVQGVVELTYVFPEHVHEAIFREQDADRMVNVIRLRQGMYDD